MQELLQITRVEKQFLCHLPSDVLVFGSQWA